jgi:hypothetical protein
MSGKSRTNSNQSEPLARRNIRRTALFLRMSSIVARPVLEVLLTGFDPSKGVVLCGSVYTAIRGIWGGQYGYHNYYVSKLRFGEVCTKVSVNPAHLVVP